MAAFAALFLLLALGSARAEAACATKAMYVDAHADDPLLFQSPDLIREIESGRCIRTVFVTAGDAGKAQSYWSQREVGVQAAYAQMAGVANSWESSTVTANGHSLPMVTLKARSDISIVYMRLPDGNTDGKGYAVTGSQSLVKLWRGGNPGTGTPTISSIDSIDGANTYTYSGLIETLRALMTAYEPQVISTQNFEQGFFEGDHPDHIGTAYFAAAASRAYAAPHRTVGYRDYDVSGYPENVSGSLLGAKQLAFYTYGAYDSGACASEPACSSTTYAGWLKRQYPTGTETTGVVADAGFAQLSETSKAVHLDGTRSSGAGGKALQYTWTQVGGPTVSLSGATTATPSFTTPSHPTRLTFSLVVREGVTSSKADTVFVRVPSEDPTPTAVVGPEQTVASGATVQLDGSGSWDPEGLALQYGWIQTSGPTVSLAGAGTASPSFTAPTGPATLKFSLAVSNGSQTSAPATVTIHVNGIAPAFTSQDHAALTTGTPASFTISTTGAPTAAITRTAGTLPAGLTLTDNGDGTATIAGTPAAAAAAPATTQPYNLTLKATNAVASTTQALTLNVTNPGAGPTFTSADHAALTTGTPASFTISTTGAPTAAITRTAGTLPAGLTLTDNGDGTATIAGTPAAAAAAPATTQPYNLTLKATNAVASTTQALTLNVTNPGAGPTFTSADHVVFEAGEGASFTITAQGAPPPAISAVGNLPDGVTLTDNGDGTAVLAGTPDPSDFEPDSSTGFPLDLTASNDSGGAEQEFTLVVHRGPEVEPEPEVEVEPEVEPEAEPETGVPPVHADTAPQGSEPGGSDPAATTVAPSFGGPADLYVAAGRSTRLAIEAAGSPTPTISLSGRLPAGLSFAATAPGRATISGAAKRVGTFRVTVQASNSVGSVRRSLRLVVEPRLALGKTRVRVRRIGKARHVIPLRAPREAIVSCEGKLPAGLRCLVKGNRRIVLLGSGSRPLGAYPLTVAAVSLSGELRRRLLVEVGNGPAPKSRARVGAIDPRAR